ncbi:MAG: DUF6455 family protein [Geminicoccaceae bacterium]
MKSDRGCGAGCDHVGHGHLEVDGDGLEQRIQALGYAPAEAHSVRERVEAYLGTMVQGFGLTADQLRTQAALELLQAETRCVNCADLDMCKGYLDGVAAVDPDEFCPNAALFEKLKPV